MNGKGHTIRKVVGGWGGGEVKISLVQGKIE